MDSPDLYDVSTVSQPVWLKGCHTLIFFYICRLSYSRRWRNIAVINNICVLNIEHQPREQSVLRSFTINSPDLEQPRGGQ